MVVRVCRWVRVEGSEVRPCDPCARVRPCVPCCRVYVPYMCVPAPRCLFTGGSRDMSLLPGGAGTHGHKDPGAFCFGGSRHLPSLRACFLFGLWMWSIVGVAVASSVADSTVLLAWICGGRASARNFTVRYVAFFALSNLVTCVSAILNNVLNNAPPTMICSGLAVAEWYGVFASWMWTAAIACAFRLCFRRGKVNPTRLEEVGMHLACWLLPAGLLGAAAALGSQFGAVDDGESGSGGSSTADSTALCGWVLRSFRRLRRT